jgi:hypothetical protein
MSRVITSPVAKYPGTITLVYPVPLDNYLDWMDANAAVMASDKTKDKIKAYLPGACALIESAQVEGLAEHPGMSDFQKLTGPPSFEFVLWLISECQKLMRDEDSPNA